MPDSGNQSDRVTAQAISAQGWSPALVITATNDAIQSLGRFVRFPDQGREAVDQIAREIHEWARIAIKRIEKKLTRSNARHHGDVALDTAMSNLAEDYKAAFGKGTSLYRSGALANPWIRFAEAALVLILAPEMPPSVKAIEARWRRHAYR